MKQRLPLVLPFLFIIFIHRKVVLGQYKGTTPDSIPSTEWKNDRSLSCLYNNTMQLYLVLLQERSNYDNFSFACGFLCPENNCDRSIFSIVALTTPSGMIEPFADTLIENPLIIWSANRNQPVEENATLKFTTDGDLALYDADGTFVWSTNTSRMGVANMTLLGSGNLVLTNSKVSRVWESFRCPTDTLMLGQSLPEGKKLVANSTDGLYYLAVFGSDMYLFVGYNPTHVYYSTGFFPPDMSDPNSLNFTNAGLFINGAERVNIADTASFHFIRIETDGHLKLHSWLSFGWVSEDLFHLDYCDYPMVCGEYGICSVQSKSCNCPTLFVNHIDAGQANVGCSPVIPLSCEIKQDHEFLVLHDISYFFAQEVDYFEWDNSFWMTTEETCKKACLQNCSCKAASYNPVNASFGLCSTVPQSYSMISSESTSDYDSSVYIKVVKADPNSTGLVTRANEINYLPIFRRKIIVCTTLGAFVFVVILIGVVIRIRIRKRRLKEIAEENIITEELPGLPTRFYFTQLEEATSNFSNKLGGGGFGSVFAGTIGDEKVAVKRLDSVNQGKQEFLAEIQTIGSIHHKNLVRLIGFCAEKSHTLLVYEYMPNGSLDKWIFNKTQNDSLDLNKRIKIITDVAKGLSYLHEECRHRIAHLDIKPQNILLDDNFNAKVSDFGLAKLIDRDQSHIVTRMKGTPGYLAPEWLTNLITEKVDVYSFGVVIIEVLCGRKNLDYSQPEENIHLISLLQNKIRDDRVLEIIDANIVDMESNVEEIMKIVRLAMWCLESEGWRRPLMSAVVKVLQGTTDLDMERENHFVDAPPVLLRGEFATSLSSALSDELISGPR